MNGWTSRRSDDVASKKLAKECLLWLNTNPSLIKEHLGEERGRKFSSHVAAEVTAERGESALQFRLTNLVKSYFTQNQWKLIKKQFYAFRKKEHFGYRSIQLPNSTYKKLAEFRATIGLQSFADAVEELLDEWRLNQKEK